MKFKLYIHPIEIESWNDKIIMQQRNADSIGVPILRDLGSIVKKGKKGEKKGKKVEYKKEKRVSCKTSRIEQGRYL